MEHQNTTDKAKKNTLQFRKKSVFSPFEMTSKDRKEPHIAKTMKNGHDILLFSRLVIWSF